MPRKARDYFLSDFLHVMVQGDEKKFIFKTESQKETYLYFMMQNALCYEVEIIAYCIMGNHAHILLYCRDIERVSKMIHHCNTLYGMYYNKSHKNVGHVFRDRFRSENIYSQVYLINCIKYIHQNPVKAGMCKTSTQYKYSSASDFLIGNKDYLLRGKYFDVEDFKKINDESIPEGKFMENEEKKVEIEKLIKNIQEELFIDEMTEEELSRAYVTLKEKYHISDENIAIAFRIGRGKLRKILQRNGIKK